MEQKQFYKVRNKAVYSITDFFPHYYNVHILTSYDGDEYEYCGVGRFCETETEVKEFCGLCNCESIKKI